MQEDRPLRALAFMLGAQLCFSINILTLRLCENAERLHGDPQFRLDPWEAMLARSLLLTAWCLYNLHRERPPRLEARENFWLWARGLAGVLSLSAYYYGVLHIPLGMASLFSNSSPFYVALLAWYFTGERLNLVGVIALIGGFSGVGMVAWGALHHLENLAPLALFIAALSGPLSATAYFSIRQLKRVSPAQIMISLGLAGSILALVVIALRGPRFPMSVQGLSWLLISSFPAILAQECLTRAFRSGPAAQVAPLQFTGPLFSSVLAWMVLDESLPPLALLGIASVLLFGCLLPYWQARKLRENG